VKAESFEWVASDARALHVYRWLPDRPRAIVQIVHGAAEHAGRYAELAEELALAGYGVYAHDQRGHGRSARSPAELGALAESGGWDRAVEDLAELGARHRVGHPGLGLVLLGHSLGSFMVQQYLGRHADTLAAAVLSGSAKLEIPAQAPDPELDAFAALNAPFEPARTRFDWLSRDPAAVDRYVADPLCGFALSPATYAQMLGAAAQLYAPGRLARIPRDLPIYLLAGDRDPINQELGALHALLETYRAAGLRRVTHRFHAGGRHEMFNETNRKEVVAELIAWLDRALSS
jgi:alpha-beta hydrolase superfamily lysophospholipase